MTFETAFMGGFLGAICGMIVVAAIGVWLSR